MPLFTLEPAGESRFAFTVPRSICVGPAGREFLFGGAGLGLGIAALEAVTGRPTVWAAAQYLSYARPETRLALEVTVPVAGNHTSQARVVARDGTREIFTVNAALGGRPHESAGQWATMPDVSRPLDCPAVVHNWPRTGSDMHANFDEHVAAGRFGVARTAGGPSDDGIARLWVRPRGDFGFDRPHLAVVADFLPSGLGNALGANAGGNSLDNTIRFGRWQATEWVLLDIRIHAVVDGFAHGRLHLFAEDGTLLATASQSMILRLH
ncbi:acyl-CoA thioesterase [alpha proteobacterium AAP81b]|nr:acyl-CoA thioesterase [alpha proteobacterium AAP81b]